MPPEQQYQQLADRAKQAIADRNQADKIRIMIGSATCENAAGAGAVHDEFSKHIRAAGREDIVLNRTGCTGRCSCEPIVTVLTPDQMPVKYQQVDRDKVHQIFTEHLAGGNPIQDYLLDTSTGSIGQYELMVCQSDRCSGFLQAPVSKLLQDKLHSAGTDPQAVSVVTTNCMGLCRAGTAGKAGHVMIRPGNVLYRIEKEDDLDRVIQEHILNNRIVKELRVEEHSISEGFFELYGDVSFFNLQTRLALRNSGVIDPESIDEYVNRKGFAALARVLEKGDREWVIDEISKSLLRGRGGGGYPTGTKWTDAASQADSIKFMICNADEGDPGAFMDRSMLEGDPFSIIEGMAIGGYAVGAKRGFFYVRAEYPLAVRRLRLAIAQAHEYGLLGKNILGSNFEFDIEIRLGAGAFVCGEETALIHSIEGERGQPRIRPPYPTQSGLWGHPTVINNVETYANVPVIMLYGANWFRQIGTASSGGTKVFALAGKVRHTGLVEVPMGTRLSDIVFNIGGGIPGNKKLKAVQTGGPAGGCIRSDFLETPIDFDTLTKAGSIMGSGGMIIMDEDDCMVDIAKFFLTFSQNESCGKCTPCREGTTRMLEILERITTGRGVPEDLDKLERLALLIKKASLCGLGRAAPNPVLSNLKYFREEFEAHVLEKRCPALRCTALIHYEIKDEKCVGCTVCARECPVVCISGERRKPHTIDQARCIQCGRCFEVCRFNAVNRY